MQELLRIHKKQFIDRLEEIKDVFLFCCFTGFAYKEVSRLTPDDIFIARHTFAATVTLENDVPIESVSKILGHKSIKTTQIYTRITQKKVSKYFPVCHQLTALIGYARRKGKDAPLQSYLIKHFSELAKNIK